LHDSASTHPCDMPQPFRRRCLTSCSTWCAHRGACWRTRPSEAPTRRTPTSSGSTRSPAVPAPCRRAPFRPMHSGASHWGGGEDAQASGPLGRPCGESCGHSVEGA
jgi:hypothetical protein